MTSCRGEMAGVGGSERGGARASEGDLPGHAVRHGATRCGCEVAHLPETRKLHRDVLLPQVQGREGVDRARQEGCPAAGLRGDNYWQKAFFA